MDYALLALASIMGFGDGPWYLVIVIGILLTLLSSARHRAYAQRYADFGTARVFAVFTTACAANNIFFAAISFVFGRGVAWLIST
jgi:hypothetical protein